MAVPQVRLVRPSALRVDADTPCVLEVNIPITLPHRLDPSLPAPPYHNWEGAAVTAEGFRDQHGITLMRQLMALIVTHTFGEQYPGTILEADSPPPLAATPHDLMLLSSWEYNLVADRKHGFDFAAGYWKDMHGAEGRGPIHAFTDALEDRIEVHRAFRFHLVRGVREAEKLRELNPRVLRFDVVEQSDGVSELHEVVFQVREYTELVRKRHVNAMVAMGIASCYS